MSILLIASILIRVAAMLWSVVLLHRVRDIRMLFLTAMLGLMALRQYLTLSASLAAAPTANWALIGGQAKEIPGLLVSVLAALSVVHLERFIRQIREQSAAIHQRDRVLEQERHLRSLGILAGGVAHDFNNLMQIVQCNIELVRLEREHSEYLKGRLDDMQHAVVRGGDLTSYLLGLAQHQQRGKQTLELNTTLNQMLHILRRLLEERIDLAVVLCEPRAWIQADSTQIWQVVMNLLVNANAAIEGHGTIRLTTDIVDDEVLICISDTGVGIDSANIDSIFDPFYTSKAPEHGTGLGLAICKRIIAEHDGRIQAESQPGKGTTFRIYLPQAEPRTVSKPQALPAQYDRGGGKKILVVEDEPLLRKTFVENLSSQGFDATEATNGVDALRMIETTPYDLLISDVMMPEMGGLELIKQLKTLDQQIPVLLISGYSDQAIEPDLPYLAKPFTASELSQKVEEMLRPHAKAP